MVFIVEVEFMSCYILGAGDPPRACQAQFPRLFFYSFVFVFAFPPLSFSKWGKQELHVFIIDGLHGVCQSSSGGDQFFKRNLIVCNGIEKYTSSDKT